MDETSSIKESQPEKSDFDFLNTDISNLEDHLLSELGNASHNTNQPLLISKTLTSLSKASIQAWKGSQFEDKKKWTGLNKHFKRAKLHLTTNFNLFESYSFRIELLNSNHQKNYYFDRSTPKNSVYLFKGKRPRTKEEKEMEKIPLNFFSSKELCDQVMNQLKKNGSLNRLKVGTYCFVGLSIEVDQNSLYKNRVPTARVVVFFGAKRLQKLKVQKVD